MSTIFASTLGANNGGNAGNSTRQGVPVSGASLGQIRVTFQAAIGSTWKTTHCSIAVVGSATAPSTQLTPTELVFGGASGFNLASNGQLTSDWVNFSCLVSDTLIIVMDDDTAGNGDGGGLAINTTTAPATNILYFGHLSPTWNLATVSGYSSSASQCTGVNLIETQAAAAGGPVLGGSRIIMM